VPPVIQIASDGPAGNGNADEFSVLTNQLLHAHRELVPARGAMVAMHLIDEGVGLAQ